MIRRDSRGIARAMSLVFSRLKAASGKDAGMAGRGDAGMRGKGEGVIDDEVNACD
jgi:hypothetical protein